MTALQDLINKWEVPIEHEHRMIYLYFIEDAKSFLEKEKQQIIDAFNEGQALNIRGKLIKGEQHYKENYE